ncbi:FtsK/SpoIIIE family protein [Streptoalloteichus tenebrarius]|uniref:FtsK/SpoIIIE family protein n=1 Tax=Streptoalloteichus tenebrarius (strain ATCC 17920 / DSM 40477 / JCM 4838 / CBS 697.72 / NBRC 16177 / NCIMB 11028 / NRRL B-12390 / A12253. 1 / ISP 5477) TaxID=1933 RepID=A0ABT1I387_STRSD|nr:FtsK/SpoIIIE domain-containing protein [Streptoalloteichus tenebrarius]MCP2262040.1 FtsK/SpoIIIE family protein [Streptoalloteichus tenebrarius]BFF01320.1 FtsK/SpoIIIE domain-containing protein [Streptoalloteichus tenebrarius]
MPSERRTERRRRIEAAFAEFRRAVASALSAAATERARAALAHARAVVELWVRQDGVDRALASRELGAVLRNPVLAPVLREALAEREEIFAEWTGRGPAEIAELVAASAPGAASLPWERWLGTPGRHDGAAPVPELWRVGVAAVDRAPVREEFPLAVPFLDVAHLHVSTTYESRAAAEGLVESLLLRVLGHFQPGMVQIHVWDVGQLTGALPGLYPLTRAGLLTMHDPTQLHVLLDELAEHIRRIHTSVLVEGHASLRELAAATGQRTEPWRVAVLFGHRERLKDELHQKLQRIARNGLDCGVHLVIVDIPITVNSPVETIDLVSGPIGRSTMTGAHATVRLDPPPPRQAALRASAVIAEEAVRRRSRVCSFEDLLPARTWSCRSTTGLQAPVGYHDGQPVSLTLGDASPHVLVGGPSGSGKTNFLYAMLGSLAARYSPDELELYLLDFKEGVSFAQFTRGRKDPSWLPHARLVGVNVNTDREFGLALLRFLTEEMRRRADAAKRHEVTKLEELRAEDPDGRWPRIVAVIDEFQYLFSERDAVTNQAVALLEDVARRGRSQGIHLVLSSQDVSSIEAFWGKPAIFEQFILRVALPKARRVLADTNDVAMELPRRHAVVNHESGVRLGNRIARIPDATSRGTFDALQVRLWEMRSPALEEPRLFDGSQIPRLTEVRDFLALAPGGEGPPVALLGQVIDVAGSAAKVSLPRGPGRNIAVLGSSARDAGSVLAAATVSLGRQHAPGEATFTIACLIDEAGAAGEQLQRDLKEMGHEADLLDLDRLRDLLADKAERITARLSTSGAEREPPHFLVVYAADAAQAVLERKEPGAPRSGVDNLRHVLRHGPELGVHTIGWWRGVARLRAMLPLGSTDEVGAWVAFDVHGQELASLAAGQVITWSPRARRGLFFDRFEHARPEVLIPFDVLEEAR